MAEISVPIVFDHDDLQRMIDEKVEELKSQFVLKKDVISMLEALKERLREIHEDFFETEHYDEAYGVSVSMDIIQEKINTLKENKNE